MSIHSPRATYNALNKINKELKIQLYDSSYKNDSCDSLEHEYAKDKFIKVIIPNSKEDDPDRELFSDYLIVLTEFGGGQFFAELDDAIDYLKDINLTIL